MAHFHLARLFDRLGDHDTLSNWQAWGIHDAEDVLVATDHVVKLGYADPERLGIGGWSYGGTLTNDVITSTDRFAGAISGASIGLWTWNSVPRGRTSTDG